jgi:peptidoglycan/xylan/chitin deacetylase (PgdA/CDA1 family)
MLEAVLLGGGGLVIAAGANFVAPHGFRKAQERLLRQRAAATRSLVLTYDDGPGATLTPRLLELLAS